MSNPELYAVYQSTPIGQTLQQIISEYRSLRLISEEQENTLIQNLKLAFHEEYQKLQNDSPDLSVQIQGPSTSLKTFKKNYDVSIENATITFPNFQYKSESLGVFAQCNVKDKKNKKH